jgi:hypothetical protein
MARGAAAFAASVGIHALAGGGLGWLVATSSPPVLLPRLVAGPVASTPREARPSEPEPAADDLARDVRAGRRLLGEALIARARLGAIGAANAREAYRALVEEARRRLPAAHPEIPRALVGLLRERELDAYKAVYHDLGSALLHRGGDCRARTELLVALLYDLGYQRETGARAFSNHVAPYFHDGKREHRFGLVANCTGLGARVGPLALLEDELPQAQDRCREERPLLGAGFRDDDPEPAWSGDEPPPDDACPLAEWPWREPGEEVFWQPDGHAWMPVQRLDSTKVELLNHAAGMECHARRLAALKVRGKGTDRVLAAFGQAVGYGEETALEFAASGELDAARAAEEDTRGWYRQAEVLLEHWNGSGIPLRAELSSLIHLGPRGQAVLFAIMPRHICWVGSDLLAILVREPATRDRALGLYLSRSLPQQIEVADRMYWTDEAFQRAVERHPAGRRALMLRALVGTARSRWHTCSFDDLLHVAGDTAREVGLDSDWVAPLVAVLAEDAHVYLADHHCPVAPFTANVQAWGADQSGDVRAWLGRQTRER